MPRRTDLKRVLVIGSGPIVIGQACEFDYSGSQACKALRAEGLEVVLVNSNPATIMTDPEMADRTYVEPLTPEFLEAIIAKEKPDAILPTVGGQTALNLAVALAERGIAIVGLEPSCLLSLRDEALVMGLGESAATVAAHALTFEESLTISEAIENAFSGWRAGEIQLASVTTGGGVTSTALSVGVAFLQLINTMNGRMNIHKGKLFFGIAGSFE